MRSIADVVSAAGLAEYAEIALLLFFAVFIAVTLRVLSANKGSLERAAHLPLEDDPHVDR
jgi:cbb3-type cytochrome oxidase subunit 3